MLPLSRDCKPTSITLPSRVRNSLKNKLFRPSGCLIIFIITIGRILSKCKAWILSWHRLSIIHGSENEKKWEIFSFITCGWWKKCAETSGYQYSTLWNRLARFNFISWLQERLNCSFQGVLPSVRLWSRETELGFTSVWFGVLKWYTVVVTATQNRSRSRVWPYQKPPIIFPWKLGLTKCGVELLG